MPILLVIFLVAACAPVAWPVPLPGWGAHGALALMLVLFALPLAGHIALNVWVLRTLRHDPGMRNAITDKYSRLRRLLGLSNFAFAILAVVLGWGWAVRVWFTINYGDGRRDLAPFAELLVPLPYLLGVFLAWAVHHDAERMMHLTSASAREPFWSRRGHFLHRLRPYLLLILFPALLIAAQQTLMRCAPEFAQSTAMVISTAAMAPLFLLLMPLLAKPALGLVSLPAGHHRERLEATAKRLNFRCTDLLLWPTRGTTANALVLGIIPQARYVVFTDHLLSHLDDDELDAVFGHEIGHVKHGHLPYYATFFILSMVIIFGSVMALAEAAQREAMVSQVWIDNWIALPPLMLFAAYLYTVFGLLSRKCERQADLYGVRTVAETRTEGHPLAAGVASMQRALSKVAIFNGLDQFDDPETTWRRRLWARILSWEHGSIADRIGFLNRVLDDPPLAARVQRRITVSRWVVLGGLSVAVLLLGIWLDWS